MTESLSDSFLTRRIERHYIEIEHEGRQISYPVEIRRDPFRLYSAAIAPKRGERRNVALQKSEKGIRKKSTKDCPFCYSHNSPDRTKPSLRHNHPFEKYYSIQNLYPYSPNHFVTPFPEHDLELENLEYCDMVFYLESMYEIAKYLEKQPGTQGILDFINWGRLAAASIPHRHAQRCAITDDMRLTSDLEYDFCRQIRSLIHPFGAYLNKLRDSGLFIFENDLVFIHAPFAPRAPDQVDIICKIPGKNILALDEYERKIIAESMLGVFHALGIKRGVTDLNVETHQSRFIRSGKGYCTHWHIMPRNKNVIGGAELQGMYVVTIPPEETAAAIREHYKNGAK